MKNEMPHPPETNDPLDELLRGADEYLPDNGFTARVLTALPAKRRHAWRRLVVLTLAMLASAAVAAWQLPAIIGILHVAMPKHWSAIQWPWLATFAALLAALASLIWAMFAIVNEEE
jgi:uncharacterized membrane protein YcjF (UPF0283 family)